MAFTVEQTARLNLIRAKSLRNEATKEELMEGIAILRQDREGAQIGSTASRTKKAEAAKPVNTAALLAGLKKTAADIAGQTFGAPAPAAPPAQGTFKL